MLLLRALFTSSSTLLDSWCQSLVPQFSSVTQVVSNSLVPTCYLNPFVIAASILSNPGVSCHSSPDQVHLSFLKSFFSWIMGHCTTVLIFPCLGGHLFSSFLCYNLLFHACAQSYLILCDPMDCSPSGSSVHGIFQARILEWVAISSSRGSSQPRDQTHISYVSCIGM